MTASAADRTPDTNSLPLTERFIQHGRILRDWSPETVTTYRKSG